MGFRDEYRRGRAEARAARGAPPLDQSDAGPDGAADERMEDDPGQYPARVAELEAALREVTEYAGQLEARAEERDRLAEQLQACAEERDLLAEALQLPGARKGLRKMYHEDAHPNADADQLRALNEWSCKLNAAYELIDRDKKSRDPAGR